MRKVNNLETVFSGMFCGSKHVLNKADVYAVDFDGCLFSTFEPYDPRKIGKPIWPMIKFTQRLIENGKKVVILTARVNSKEHTQKQLIYTRNLIRKACKQFIGKELPITAEKHSNMKVMFDDRAVQVVRDQGLLVLSDKDQDNYWQQP